MQIYLYAYIVTMVYVGDDAEIPDILRVLLKHLEPPIAHLDICYIKKGC